MYYQLPDLKKSTSQNDSNIASCDGYVIYQKISAIVISHSSATIDRQV